MEFAAVDNAKLNDFRKGIDYDDDNTRINNNNNNNNHHHHHHHLHGISHFSALAGKYSPILGCSNQQD